MMLTEANEIGKFMFSVKEKFSDMFSDLFNDIEDKKLDKFAKEAIRNFYAIKEKVEKVDGEKFVGLSVTQFHHQSLFHLSNATFKCAGILMASLKKYSIDFDDKNRVGEQLDKLDRFIEGDLTFDAYKKETDMAKKGLKEKSGEVIIQEKDINGVIKRIMDNYKNVRKISYELEKVLQYCIKFAQSHAQSEEDVRRYINILKKDSIAIITRLKELVDCYHSNINWIVKSRKYVSK